MNNFSQMVITVLNTNKSFELDQLLFVSKLQRTLNYNKLGLLNSTKLIHLTKNNYNFKTLLIQDN